MGSFKGVRDHSREYPKCFDHFDPNSFGGRGLPIAESLLKELENHPVLNRSFLAGRLTSANVGALVKRLKPFGVDVASGIESAVGKKDLRKMKSFMDAVRGQH